ncbi:MAG TPA: VIT domain-containing protein, partial [Nannocystaceae bacterium]|nr:VIT domain-containing protein [Nannocystaceae bacterium]
MLTLAGCASSGMGQGLDEPALDEELVGDVVAPPAPRGTRLAWDGPPDESEPWTEAGEIPRLLASDGSSLPLRLTDVHADVRGHIADVVVTQRFVNDRDAPIEVVYTFPLPENAAVTDMRMVIGERVIESEVRKRDEARKAYMEAREDGYTAALLEQERPDVFTQSVANIHAGAVIDVEIHYLQTLSFDAGTFELVFPMVVGPRYMPGRKLGGPPSGTGTHADTDRVPDASRISPPVIGPDMRAGDDIAITVDIDAGGPIAEYTAPTHGIDAHDDGGRLHVELARADERPNRDFLLRWRPAPKEVRSTLFVGPPGRSGVGHFELLVVPPAIDVDARVGRREFVFVLDVSGSMMGGPLALEKTLMRKALANLRPVDTFDVVTFESGTRRLFARPQPANAARIDEALRFVDGLHAGGGTEMLAGAQLALGDDVARGRTRYVVFLTDGFIGNEPEIFAAARRLVREQAKAGRVARVFAMGIGSSPNHHLIKGLARAGSGMAMSVSRRDDPERAIARMQHVIDAAILERVEVEWNGARVESMFPSKLPDLFASHLLVVHGRYRGTMPSTGIELHARAQGRRVALPVHVVPAREEDRVLSRLWARERVAELEERLWAGDDPSAREGIERIGLQHHLVTQFTSLVAIDRSRRVEQKGTTVVQPTNAPEDVDVEAAGGVGYSGPIPGGGNDGLRRLIRVSAAPVTQSSTVGRVVQMEEFRTIPVPSNVGRDFTAVVESSSGTRFGAGGISLAGTTGAQSKYSVEGASVDNPRFGTVGAAIVQDFLEEVEIQEAGYEAEHGGAAGGQLQARRVSGTNRFRGVARFSYTPRLGKPRYITGTDEALRIVEVPDYALQGVVVMSGPIVKDRLFWTGGVVVTGGRSSLVERFHHGDDLIAEQKLKTGGIDLQFVAGLDWAIDPRHHLKITALANPGFDRRSFRQPPSIGHDPGFDLSRAPLGGAARIADGLVDGQLGWDRSNSTIATLGYTGRVWGDRLEIDANLGYAEFADIAGWKLDNPTIRDRVATQQFADQGASLFELLDREDRLDLAPGVATACNDAGTAGVACPVRQWQSGGMGQFGQSRQRRVSGSFALTHFFQALGAHQLKYGAQIDHLEDATRTRYSGRNAADFSGEGHIAGDQYVVDTADRVDNHRFVFADDEQSDVRTTLGYGRVAGDLGAIATPGGAAQRVAAYRAKLSTQNYAVFLQDRVAILSNLFLTAGVRWELQDLRDVLGRRAVLLWDNVAPR